MNGALSGAQPVSNLGQLLVDHIKIPPNIAPAIALCRCSPLWASCQARMPAEHAESQRYEALPRSPPQTTAA
jgi:hypothetical protein